MQKQKIALGFSGGVDSAVSAHLLVEQGYEVTAFFIECWSQPGCRAEQDRKDALKITLALSIPFQVLDFRSAYQEKVMALFFREYEAGRTPNPDTACNKEIKFGLFYDYALQNGYDFVATGHYARISRLVNQSTSQLVLSIPKDKHKDQTYFLYQLKKEQLAHILFPVADLTKSEVRVLAKTKNIHVADKKDSVGICFVGDINVPNFLKEQLGEKPGEIVDTEGKVLGEHRGLWFYTIGQRHGFSIKNTSSQAPALFVIAKNKNKNQLVVGVEKEAGRQEFVVGDLNWLNKNLAKNLLVRVRHTGQLLPCQVSEEKDLLKVKLDAPERGIAPGQAAVFYRDGVCLGGGVIH